MIISDKEKRRAALHNLGCKVNAYEMDAVKELLIGSGYEIVSFDEPADIYIVNTCTVTNIADRKSRQMLHRAKKRSPGAVVVAMGCYVQSRGEAAAEDEAIDICVGNNRKTEIVQIIEDYIEHRNSNSEAVDDYYADNLTEPVEYEDMRLERIDSHTRAYIKIQDGCNQFCSYCMIPYARGRVRSRKPEEVLAEIKSLSENGVSEFVVTGIHLSSYGTDFDIKGRIVPADTFGPDHLLDILTQISAIEKVKRIRLGSLEPRIMTEDFVRQLSSLEKICPHFHLSLQSGSDTVLKRMNRHYDGAEYLECVELLRKYFDNPAITTDIIAGFPGETEEEFEQSVSFAEKVGFFEMHIFPYSKRSGTPAAVMPGQLSEAEKAERVGRLETAEKKLSENYRMTQVGQVREVLFEEMREFDGRKYFFGHTREYVKVLVPVDDECMAADDTGNRLLLEQGMIAKALIRGLYDGLESGADGRVASVGHGRMYVLADLINDKG